MDKIQVAPASQYASFLTPEASNMLTTEEAPLVELPTDEINVDKAAEIDAVIGGKGTLTHVDGTSEEITVFPYPQEGSREELRGKTLVQQSMSTLKELTNNSEVQKVLESEGLTVDYSKAKDLIDGLVNQTEWKSDDAIIRSLTEEDKVATEDAVACACTDCVEEADNSVDTDTMLIVHDLSERMSALEARIADYNLKASHKI